MDTNNNHEKPQLSMPTKGGLNLGLASRPTIQIAPSPEFYTNSESS